MVHVDRARLEVDPNCVKRSLDAIAALQADDHQVVCSAVLGHKADMMIMAVGPDLARLHQFQADLLGGPLHLSDSFVSLTELSPYTSVEADERARLIREDGLNEEAEITAKLAIWAERMTHYQEHRIHPQLPDKKVLCFYPMLKRRDGADNWYSLPFDDRKRLMGGHAKTGRSYSGRVIQLITGATGLDDWEWGVTLFADDPVVIKDIVHEMRFDEVSARYAEFGTFVVGLCGQAADVFAAAGLVVRPE